MPESDLVIFCDDDFVPSHFYVERVRAFFAAHADVVGLTGKLLADGINGPGISPEEASAMLARHDRLDPPPLIPKRDFFGLYGCNMAFRLSAIGDNPVRRAIAALTGGRKISTFQPDRPARAAGVLSRLCRRPLRDKGGTLVGRAARLLADRQPGLSGAQGDDAGQICRQDRAGNFAANHLRALRPEPWADRPGGPRATG